MFSFLCVADWQQQHLLLTVDLKKKEIIENLCFGSIDCPHKKSAVVSR